MASIYYGDGSVYAGNAYDAPGRNVVAIVQPSSDHGWRIVSGTDYYVLWGDAWEGVDMFGLWDYLCEPGPRKVLFGRTIGNAEYAQIFSRAVAEHGVKTAFGQREHRP